ncbi:hypothetical protein, partial [Rhizobium sp. BR 249]|uniref:hypothetical protein n=1 Tax=Rhizobium sp. BR 249 TaxID=3040011 RepID=UPI0039BF5AE4
MRDRPASNKRAWHRAGLLTKSANSSFVMLGLVPLVSGLNLVDKAHGVDSTRIRMFGDNPGHEREATPCGTRIA